MNTDPFKVGDRVKYTSGNHGDTKSNPLWGGYYGFVKGRVTATHKYGKLPINVEWDNNHFNTYRPADIEMASDLPESLFEL